MGSNLRKLLSVFFVFFSGIVNAQSAFEGFYSQIGAVYEYNKIGGDAYTEQGFSLKQSSTSSNSGRISLSAGYNYIVDPKTLLGVGVEYYSLTPKMTATNLGCSSGCNDKLEYQLKDRINIFITPGLVMEKDSLIYGKIGFSRQSGKGTIRQIVSTDANDGYSVSKSVNGYVLGVGYKKMIDEGVYYFGELNYYGYSEFDQNGTTPNGNQASNLYPKPTAYNAIVGLGYKFK
jgi:hypothetical protein